MRVRLWISFAAVWNTCAPTRGRGQLVVLILLLSLGWPLAVNAQKDRPTVEQPTGGRIEIGKLIERELAGGERHIFPLELAANQLLNIVADQRGVDVAVTLFAPDGTRLFVIDSPNGTYGEEAFAVLTELAGTYQIEIRAVNAKAASAKAASAKAASGGYQLYIQATRAGRASDYRIPGLVRPLTREIAGGQTHRYELALSKGEYLHLLLEQLGIDVVLAVIGPDGKELLEIDNPYGSESTETLHLYAASDGVYRLEVRSLEKEAKAAKYEIRNCRLSPANDQDRALIEVELLNVTVSNLLVKHDYRSAISVTEKVLALREKIFGAEHALVARSLSRLGDFYLALDDNRNAEIFFHRALTTMEKLPAVDANDLGWAYFTLGNLYKNMEYFAKAEPLLQRALSIWERSATVYPITAVINLGEMYKMWGDYAKAETLFLNAVAVLDNNPAYRPGQVAMFLLDLGSLYVTTGQFDKAVTVLQRAKKQFEVPEARENPDTALVDLNLGFIYERKGDYDKAEAYYLNALTVSEKFGRPRLTVLTNLGDLYRAKNDFAKARDFYQRVITRVEERWGAEDLLLLDALQGMAEMHRAKGDLASAIVTLERALNLYEKHLTRNLANGSERQKLLSLSRYSQLIDVALTLNAQSAPKNAHALELAFTALLRHKGRVLDTMFDSIAVLRQRASAQDQALLTELATARTQLATWVLNKGNQTDGAAYQARLKQYEERFEQIEAEIARRSEPLRELIRPVSPADIRRLLPADTTLIEIVRYVPIRATTAKMQPARYSAYLATAQGELTLIDLGLAAPIDQAIEQWRQALQNRRRRDVNQLARIVYDRVMKPMRLQLGTTRKLLISPDGALNLLPFAALVDEAGEHLVHHYSINYLTSGRDLLRLQTRSPRDSTTMAAAVVLADPSFGKKVTTAVSGRRDLKPVPRIQSQPATLVDDPAQLLAKAYFSPLPGTAGEAAAIKSLIPAAVLLTKSAANEVALKKVKHPRILHVATHGFFLKDVNDLVGTDKEDDSMIATATRDGGRVVKPYLRSGLALAGANLHKPGDDDGIMSALEVAGLDLWGTKLVVLSACDTGVGEIRNGDGVYGLRRALVLAGSESQVMSLWRVSDRGTKELMATYYERLLRGEGRGEALREVQLQMLRGRIHAHPYYWASFIQSGEWANLDGRR